MLDDFIALLIAEMGFNPKRAEHVELAEGLHDTLNGGYGKGMLCFEGSMQRNGGPEVLALVPSVRDADLIFLGSNAGVDLVSLTRRVEKGSSYYRRMGVYGKASVRNGGSVYRLSSPGGMKGPVFRLLGGHTSVEFTAANGGLYIPNAPVSDSDELFWSLAGELSGLEFVPVKKPDRRESSELRFTPNSNSVRAYCAELPESELARQVTVTTGDKYKVALDLRRGMSVPQVYKFLEDLTREWSPDRAHPGVEFGPQNNLNAYFRRQVAWSPEQDAGNIAWLLGYLTRVSGKELIPFAGRSS
ncbi:hypothetical protein HYY74_08180 [Candidatus Woesearchaeota archaeon]|nr:hypothetical protein [Candidatus Woesearchaeota archaeon]